jgi:hypothetical protein
MQNVIVEVRGGVVVEIYSDNPDTRITVVDWDEASEGEQTSAGFEWRPSRLDEIPADTDAEYRKVIAAFAPDESIFVAKPTR